MEEGIIRFCSQRFSSCSWFLIYTRPVRRAARICTFPGGVSALDARAGWSAKESVNIRPSAQREIKVVMLKHQINAVAAVCTLRATQQRIPTFTTYEETRIAFDELVARGLECWISAPSVLIAVQLLYHLEKLFEAVALDAPGMQPPVHCNVFAMFSIAANQRVPAKLIRGLTQESSSFPPPYHELCFDEHSDLVQFDP